MGDQPPSARCRQARRSLATLALSVPRPLLLSRSSGHRAATDGLEGTVDLALGGRDTRRSRKFGTKLIKTSRCLIRSLVARMF